MIATAGPMRCRLKKIGRPDEVQGQLNAKKNQRHRSPIRTQMLA